MAGLRRLMPRSLRARLTVLAALIAAAVFSVTSSAVLALIPNNLQEVLEARNELAARRVAGQARAGELSGILPEPVRESGAPREIQVVDDGGRVVAATAKMHGKRPLAAFRPSRDETIMSREIELRTPAHADHSRAHLVSALRVPSPYGHVTVYAAVDLTEVNRARTWLNVLIFAGAPFVVLVVAWITWITVGLTLRPVERIRAQLEEISGRDLSRRVPVSPSGDEVARLAVTTNATLDRLERSAEAQRRFVADASHELRSPITSLRLELEADCADPEGADWPVSGRRALEATERLSEIVDELLMLARLDAGATAERRVVDLRRLCSEQLRRLETARVPVHADLAAAAPVLGSPVQLDRLLTNLLDNAVRHARERVELRVAVEGDQVVVTVADDGAGIAPEDRERVFERFTRLREGRRLDKGGSGLGLPLSREIATSHGGTLTVEDPPPDGPQGAYLVLRLPGLPATQPSADTGAAMGIDAADDGDTGSPHGGATGTGGGAGEDGGDDIDAGHGREGP